MGERVCIYSGFEFDRAQFESKVSAGGPWEYYPALFFSFSLELYSYIGYVALWCLRVADCVLSWIRCFVVPVIWDSVLSSDH